MENGASPAISPVAALSVENVSRWYGNVVAVNDISFALDAGITGLLGPNGAGKSTLLHMLAGILKPSSGAAKIGGEPAWENPDIYKRVGFVPEREAVYPFLSGLDFVKLSARLHNLSDPDAAATVLAAPFREVLLVTADATASAALNGADLDRWRALGTPAARAAADLAASRLDRGARVHDPLAVAALVEPGLLTTLRAAVRVECTDPTTYGATRFAAEVDERRGRVSVAIGADRARYVDLLDAALGLISIEQNAAMKVFSWVAVVLMPPTLIAGIYGMNFRYFPELEWRFGYALAIFVMLASAVIPFWILKRLRWI